MKKPLGQFLKESRVNLGLSQEEVADYVRVSKSAISRWESGDIKNMGIDKLKKIANILKIDPIDIINYDEFQPTEIDYFTTPKEAMDFLLNQQVVMGFNGLDITTLSEKDQIDYANEVLNMMKLVSLKYKDKL